MITFSFIVPIFNCIEYLEDCVYSLLEVQKHCTSNYEIILVDDGSNDGTEAIVDELAEKHRKYVTALHQENAGVSAARNAGILKSTGTYIVFIDADDKIYPSEMGELFDALRKCSECDMAIYGLKYETIHNNRVVSVSDLIPPLSGMKDKEEWRSNMLALFQSNALTSVWSRVIKREIIINNNISFDESMIAYEDLDFNLRVMAQCKMIYFTPKIIYQYQVRVDEGRFQKRLERIRHISYVVDKIENSICNIKQDDETARILISVYSLFLNNKKIGKNKKYILNLYDEFRNWVDLHDYYSFICNDRNLNNAYHGRCLRCMLIDNYHYVRHQVALIIKKSNH